MMLTSVKLRISAGIAGVVVLAAAAAFAEEVAEPLPLADPADVGAVDRLDVSLLLASAPQPALTKIKPVPHKCESKILVTIQHWMARILAPITRRRK